MIIAVLTVALLQWGHYEYHEDRAQDICVYNAAATSYTPTADDATPPNKPFTRALRTHRPGIQPGQIGWFDSVVGHTRAGCPSKPATPREPTPLNRGAETLRGVRCRVPVSSGGGCVATAGLRDNFATYIPCRSFGGGELGTRTLETGKQP